MAFAAGAPRPIDDDTNPPLLASPSPIESVESHWQDYGSYGGEYSTSLERFLGDFPESFLEKLACGTYQIYKRASERCEKFKSECAYSDATAFMLGATTRIFSLSSGRREPNCQLPLALKNVNDADALAWVEEVYDS